jgi:hypothetical protein
LMGTYLLATERIEITERRGRSQTVPTLRKQNPPFLSLRVRTRDAGIWDKEGIVNDRSDFQPFTLEDPITWGFAPGWYGIGPSALTVANVRHQIAKHSESANGALYTSLGRSPR